MSYRPSLDDEIRHHLARERPRSSRAVKRRLFDAETDHEVGLARSRSDQSRVRFSMTSVADARPAGPRSRGTIEWDYRLWEHGRRRSAQPTMRLDQTCTETEPKFAAAGGCAASRRPVSACRGCFEVLGGRLW